MYKSALALCIAGLALAPLQPAYAQKAQTEQTAKKVDSETKNFVKNARIGGMFEVESSKLALEKSQDSGIRSFAQQMVDDHTKANEQLETTLTNANLMVDQPSSPDKLDKKHQAMLDKLRKASGDQFNKMYVKMQQDAHDEAVKLFTSYSKKGDNAEVKSFASETLPTLQEHRKHINSMNVS
jgi:putative membrane protein